ncbi:phosphoserine phosphatase SerB [Aestuariivirga sp.]|uniref:phosphoserine phosphatase SerB n=1 Tax=Aestuariivirga sp. TaxID=2650926 RepID=UPI0039E6A43E
MTSLTVLIAAPGSGAITPALAKGLAITRVLAEGEAVESALSAGEARLAVSGHPIDVAAVPAANRRKRLLVADMDSTMIDQECIDELGEAAGLGPRIRDITFRAMRGELDFADALRERVSLMKGLDAAFIDAIIRERITYASGGKILVATMKAHGATAILVSGGFRQFTAKVAGHIGFDANEANDLVIENGKLAGLVREPILGKDAKVTFLNSYAEKAGLTPVDAIAVGDGANDIPMLLHAGMGVALHAKPHVQQQASIAINHGDLTSLLYLQGYARSDFIRPQTNLI